MADVAKDKTSSNDAKPCVPRPKQLSKYQKLNNLYALPAPLRTFPFPTLVPHNPLSLIQILYTWVSHTLSPPSSHLGPLYQGWFSPDTRSVHVTDIRAVRGLWEQGFYGKGSLSRSEPSWLDREKKRRGSKVKKTSEQVTRERRAERQQTKWERARKEREAIDQRLLEEAEAARESEFSAPELFSGRTFRDTSFVAEQENLVREQTSNGLGILAPVGPNELLALPNSAQELNRYCQFEEKIPSCFMEDLDSTPLGRSFAPPVGPLELLALPNSLPDYFTSKVQANGIAKTSARSSTSLKKHSEPQSPEDQSDDREYAFRDGLDPGTGSKAEFVEILGGSETNEDTAGSTHSEETIESSSTTPNGSALANGSTRLPKMKRQKSVRFSPTVEKNMFIQTDPPSPERVSSLTIVEEAALDIKDQEHTQLTLEEAFFLSYGLGALEILDQHTNAPINHKDLFTLFRKSSYYPPTANPALSPDDPFMVNYVVYHHFRSLGWVPRSGVKFSADLMLYVRGPVFTHAEFAVLILPSYSAPYWSSDIFLQNYVKSKERRTWAWISCINRVISQVKKTLILAYVDIPTPLARGEEEELGIDQVLGRYKIREIVMKRWVANRSRD